VSGDLQHKVRRALHDVCEGTWRSDTGWSQVALQSLVATRLAATLSVSLDIHVPIRTVITSTSIEDLVATLATLFDKTSVRTTLNQSPAVSSSRRRSALSFSQERMAFMQALAHGTAAYHVAFGLRLRGRIDEVALGTAIASLPDRHPTLRTRFVASSGGIVPLPTLGARLPLNIIVSEDDVMSTASEFCNAPFDLERGRTGRVALIRRTSGDALLVFAFHHIVMDQWSYEILLRDLQAGYLKALGVALAAEPLGQDGYPAYSLQHRHWFREHAFVRERDYWLGQLMGASRVSFEPDFPRAPVTSYRGARMRLEIDEATWRTLEKLANDHQCTLAMLLFAALALLLNNHSGQSDLTMGLPIANRNHHGSGHCVGTLVNALAIRVNLEDAPDFAALLKLVRSQFLDAFEHQDMPFEVLINQLRLPREAGLSPLFGVMLNMLNVPATALAVPGVDIERAEIDRKGSQFDLTLTVDRTHTRSVWFEYATGLYSRATIGRISRRYQTLLECLPEFIRKPLRALPHIAREEAMLLGAWGRGLPAAPEGLHVFDVVRQVASSRPHDIAVQCGASTVIYEALLKRALGFSAELRRLGHGRGDRIGLMLGRSADLPVALLGSLHAGVTFVPLDPSYPMERIAFMIRDAELSLVVVEDPAVTPALLDSGVQHITLASLCDAASDPLDQWIPDPALSAYILYTSGTTGKPKGVVVPQRALANFLVAMLERPGIHPGDRLLAITTLSFDISLLELLLPLAVGARVVIATREQALDGHALGKLIEDFGITVMQGTPSTWYQLLESAWAGKPSLRALVGGERLPKTLAERLQSRVAELWNMYGPTETTIWSTVGRIDLSKESEISIGRPIAGTWVHVSDAAGRTAGIGVPGEILIGGSGLASGYNCRPGLTEERFRPFPRIDPERIYYRTGDRGRWNEHGQLECMGRIDSQLKVRGYRIEPGEIEAVAAENPGVIRALLTVSSGAAHDVRLILYVAVDTDDPAIGVAVKARLKESLPDFMIPQAVVPVRAIPLLPNGKVDTRALESAGLAPVSRNAVTPPQTETEAMLLTTWRELLNIDVIDRGQDFFELGGHSLLAMRLVTRIREDLHRHCTLSQVFQNPTIAKLAVALRSTAPHTSSSLVPLRLEGEAPPIFLVCGVQIYRALAARLGNMAPVFAAYVPTEEDMGMHNREPEGIPTLAKAYIETIREQQPQGPYRLVGFSLGGVIAYEMAQQLVDAGERVASLVILDSDVPGLATVSRLANTVRRIGASVTGRQPAASRMPYYLRAIRAYRARPYRGRAMFVEATLAERYDPGRGWDALIENLTHIKVPAAHLELMAEPWISGLAARLNSELVSSL
jgi:amino acid adenylation domain-containing protein